MTTPMLSRRLTRSPVWSAINEPREGQLEVIEALIRGGANLAVIEYPTGHAAVDAVLGPHFSK